MGAKLLPSLCPKPSFFPSKCLPKTHNLHFHRGPRIIRSASDSPGDTDARATAAGSKNNINTNDNNKTAATTAPPRQPPSPLNIRYRSKRQKQQQQNTSSNSSLPPPPPPKAWEEMTVGEKTVELYMGEKGLLFWLNKFAYASIFIIIGGWILFRFVGPALNLYQLDAPPLSPTTALKG